MQTTRAHNGMKEGKSPADLRPTAEIVISPKPYQGVGDALRHSYPSNMAEMPPEWRGLLDRLD